MPTRPTPAAPQDLPEVDPQERMAGSPFAIPPSPQAARRMPAAVLDQGDVPAFLAALGLIFALVSLVGIAVLPGR
ncbi:hypothetical protein QWZ14_20275 [Paeniroseomonas aquatica]|uniref:Uncharacterized protein n=1 Tax=Paeniroseomonas aquatica TaxID=373043 RepID=A0ABT8AAM3_9PROT|nr:hypothetical protein [Paeniroseomonas aquatica]MDN3566718.1 hypothetical protein [Paeniroseomonas aquatica]